MRRSKHKRLLWGTTSVLLYLCGFVLVLAVAVSLFAAIEAGSVEPLTGADVVFLLVGIGLIATARWMGWRFDLGLPRSTDLVRGVGREEPEPSKLEQLGYRVPPEPNDERDRDFAYEDGTIYRVCPECGANNDSEYRFCRDCSAELPE